MKYFAISDVHSFYSIMKEALDAAGFDPSNENHTLVVCGDLFDRGDETTETYEYVKGLPRKILVRGNHEDLLEEMVARGYPLDHDFLNGTAKTLCDLNGIDVFDYYLGLTGEVKFPVDTEKTRGLLKWIDDNFVDYAEFSKYVAVHSWIPMRRVIPRKWSEPNRWAPNPRWRESGDVDWQKSRWGNPYDSAKSVGGAPRGKRIIAGHWHVSYAWMAEEGTPEFGPGAKFDVWKGRNIVMIDACTAESGKCNVFEFEDDAAPVLGKTKSEWEKEKMEKNP